MKSFIPLFALFVFVSCSSFAQTQASKIIYKFPLKGTPDAKTATLQPTSASDKKHVLLIVEDTRLDVVLKNGKSYVFEVTGSTGTSGVLESTPVKPGYTGSEGTSGIFRIPKPLSSDPLKAAPTIQIFTKGIVMTDEQGNKKYFQLTNADSFPCEKLTEGTGTGGI